MRTSTLHKHIGIFGMGNHSQLQVLQLYDPLLKWHFDQPTFSKNEVMLLGGRKTLTNTQAADSQHHFEHHTYS